MTNPLTDPYFVLSKVYSGGKFLKQAVAETPVEPLNKARTVKICYGVVEKDIYLNWLISSNAHTPPKASIKLILKIALYMLEFMGKHGYMVVDSAVELCKKLGKGGAAGFVNGFLRGYKVPPLPENATEAISLKCSAPQWLVKKLRRSYKGECEQILSAPSPGVCVRFKRGEEKYLEREHVKTPFGGVYIFKNFGRDEGFFAGDYTFQSVGSIAICNAILPAERLLDACAAPGGKSVYLSEKCAYITACELHPHRTGLIKSYCDRMGVKNVTPVTCDSTVFKPEWEGEFDAVLCDAPCSGTGVVNENPDIKLNRSEEDVASLCAVQAKILDNCARYVKEGGTLYYSTCSLLPEENDSAAVGFLGRNKNFSLSVPDSPLEHRKTAYGLQFLPHISLGAGFYLTAFTRNKGASAPDYGL